MDWDDRSVLVTGGSGFIGSHLVRKLVARGARVHLLQRPDSDLQRLGPLAERVVVHRCKLADRHGLSLALRQARPDHVFHLAAEARANLARTTEASERSLDDTIRPLICLVDGLATLPQPPLSFVRAGSGAECGSSEQAFDEMSPEHPVSAYGVAMLAGTKYLGVLAPELPFACMTARLALTYGPDQARSFLIPELVSASIAGREVQLKRPLDRRDLIHVEDVADAILLFATVGPRLCTPVVNLCSGHAPTMREVADLIVEFSGCSPALFPNATDAAPGDPTILRMDNALARDRFGWSPKIALRDGLAQLIEQEKQMVSKREIAGAR